MKCCDICGMAIEDEIEAYELEDGTICEECYEASNYFECVDCGDKYIHEFNLVCDEDGYYHCDTCIANGDYIPEPDYMGMADEYKEEQILAGE